MKYFKFHFCTLSAGLLKENIVMLNFLPQLTGRDSALDYKENGEFVIVIDRSGTTRSMTDIFVLLGTQMFTI